MGTNLQNKLMQKHYELQLLTARRLARHRHKRMLELGLESPDPVEQRKLAVKRVAQELYERLIFTGSDNPMVDDITEKLGVAMGSDILLTYPAPAPLREEHLRLLRQPEDKQEPPTPLSEAEQAKALHLLWKITLQTVNDSMV